MKAQKRDQRKRYTLTDLRRDPHRVLRASRQGEVLITYKGRPVASLRRWETRGTGQRSANERRRAGKAR